MAIICAHFSVLSNNWDDFFSLNFRISYSWDRCVYQVVIVKSLLSRRGGGGLFLGLFTCGAGAGVQKHLHFARYDDDDDDDDDFSSKWCTQLFACFAIY